MYPLIVHVSISSTTVQLRVRFAMCSQLLSLSNHQKHIAVSLFALLDAVYSPPRLEIQSETVLSRRLCFSLSHVSPSNISREAFLTRLTPDTVSPRKKSDAQHCVGYTACVSYALECRHDLPGYQINRQHGS